MSVPSDAVVHYFNVVLCTLVCTFKNFSVFVATLHKKFVCCFTIENESNIHSMFQFVSYTSCPWSLTSLWPTQTMSCTELTATRTLPWMSSWLQHYHVHCSHSYSEEIAHPHLPHYFDRNR